MCSLKFVINRGSFETVYAADHFLAKNIYGILKCTSLKAVFSQRFFSSLILGARNLNFSSTYI